MSLNLKNQNFWKYQKSWALLKGGLAAVMYTDAAQALIMIVGSVSLTFIALNDTESWSPEKFKEKFRHFNYRLS